VANDNVRCQHRRVVMIREFRKSDTPVLWTLSTLPNIGSTADLEMPLALPAAVSAPTQFADLADVSTNFTGRG
jgi:hypothetical protein